MTDTATNLATVEAAEPVVCVGGRSYRVVDVSHTELATALCRLFADKLGYQGADSAVR